MSGLPVLLGAMAGLYLINREGRTAETVGDMNRKEADAEKTIKSRNKNVRKTREDQDKPDKELHRKPKDRAGNNTLSGQEGTHDDLPNEQTEPLPDSIRNDVEGGKLQEDPEPQGDEIPDGVGEVKTRMKPDSEFEAGTLKDNGRILSKRGTGVNIN